MFSHDLNKASVSAAATCLLVWIAVAFPINAEIASYDQAGDSTVCAFNPAWIATPSPIDEVATSDRTPDGDPDSSFCDFYQFSWQNFLHLVSPTPSSPSKTGNAYKAKFLDSDEYLPYISDGNPCAVDAAQSTFFRMMPTGLEPRQWKSINDPNIYQAKSNAVIYDQNRNAVAYSTRFSSNLCDVAAIQPQPYFPAGTTELKMAWRLLEKDDDKSLYYTVKVPKGAVGKAAGEDTGKTAEEDDELTLGLVGFHVVIATEAHPEMIWITIEHNLNNPYCNGEAPFQPKSAHAFSFTSKECAESPENCELNDPPQYENKNAPLTGNPTEICQVYPYGQFPDELDPKVNDNAANQRAIQDLYAGFLKAAGNTSSWAKVWTNYRMIGALWIAQPFEAQKGEFNSSSYESGVPDKYTHQRGSLALANTVAETDFQGPYGSSSVVRNCFGCHSFDSNDTEMILPVTLTFGGSGEDQELSPGTGKVSHIFGNIFRANCSGDNPVDVRLLGDITDSARVAKTCNSACGDKVWNGKFNQTGNQQISCNCCTASK